MARTLRALIATLFVAAVLWLSSAPDARATTVLRLSDVALAEESDLIVLAEVVEQRTVRSPDDGLLYTDSLLSVSEALAGKVELGRHLQVRQLGGRDGDESRFVPGDAQLRVGDVAVFFLADRTPQAGVVYLTALGQSKLDVVARTVDGDLVLARDLAGLTFYDPRAEEPLFVVDEVETLTLTELRTRIHEEATP